MVLHPPRMHWSAQQVLPCEEDTPQAWGAQGLGPQPHRAPSRGPHDLEGHLLGSDSELGFSQERGGCRRSPLAGSGKTGVHRQLRLTGSQGGGQQAVGSCAASVVWERSPRSSSQRFSVVGSVRERVGESELRVRWSRHQAPLPGWELALAPSLPPSGYKIARNRLWLLGVQRQKEEIDIMQVLGSVNGVPLAPLPC